jgi:hypothetical protein
MGETVNRINVVFTRNLVGRNGRRLLILFCYYQERYNIGTADNTGFAASFHFVQTAFGDFAKPRNVK